jgi:choice-of-anchor B domain-containing protein
LKIDAVFLVEEISNYVVKRTSEYEIQNNFIAILLSLGFLAQSQKNIRFRSNLQYQHTLSNIWGYYDSIQNKEYAIVGVETGISIVDVTNPDQPSQVFFVPNDTSLWQEPKTWKNYVYNTNEKGGGLLIIDLSGLPGAVSFSKWRNVPGQDYTRSHTCFVDEKGTLYLNGSDVFNRGSIICDLNTNPMNPTVVGRYDDFYVHDCFARNDTLYSSEILNGQFSVVDVTDKLNPIVLARQTTPFAFSHNVWLSDDGRYLFNTDEKKFATVTSYDISDPTNITELDAYRHSDYDSSIPHNTYWLNGYLFTSYYRDGVTIVDAHKPDNLVEVGYYDTSPFPPGEGFEGCWGVYCFLPSGNILCSDRQEGLFVLTPTLKRACYLEGKVTDSQTGNVLPSVTVEIVGQQRIKQTNFLGGYKTGVADSGLYDVRFFDSNRNCYTKIVSGILLQPGQTTILNAALNCSFPSSLNEILNDKKLLEVFPLPFQNILNIKIENAQVEPTVITAYNSFGEKISEWKIETQSADIEWRNDLPTGVYYIESTTIAGRKITKAVKQ